MSSKTSLDNFDKISDSMNIDDKNTKLMKDIKLNSDLSKNKNNRVIC